MALQNNKAKHWCFTINNPTELDYATLIMFRTSVSYIIYGVEHGQLTTAAGVGTPHLQGYFCLNVQKTRTTLSKILDRAHLEVKRGTVREAIDYCKKGDQSHEEWSQHKNQGPHYGLNADVIVHGIEPAEANEAGHKASMEKYDETMKLAKEGNFGEINSKHSLLYFNNIRNVRQEVLNTRPRTTLKWEHGSPPNLWIYGTTGTGKSKKAWDEFPDAYRKMCNKWWDGYNDEPVVVLEDLGLTHEYLGDHLKIWADRYPFRGERKGHTVMLRPERIVVTSNYHPDDLWKDPNVLNPILRRFVVQQLVAIQPVDARPSQKKLHKASKHQKEVRPSLITKKPPLYRQNAQGHIVENFKGPTNQRELLFGPLEKETTMVDLTSDNSSEEMSGVSSESPSSWSCKVYEDEPDEIGSMDSDHSLTRDCEKCGISFLDCPCKF